MIMFCLFYSRSFCQTAAKMLTINVMIIGYIYHFMNIVPTPYKKTLEKNDNHKHQQFPFDARYLKGFQD